MAGAAAGSLSTRCTARGTWTRRSSSAVHCACSGYPSALTIRATRTLLLLFLVCAVLPAAVQSYSDRTHDSKVFGEARHYRIFLPRDYETSTQRYPVIYYFHGHSDRYTLEKYDGGLDTVPKIAAFAATHGVIVVAADGYIAKDYTGFYGGSPYDVRIDGGQFDYGEYFLELVRHIDATWRTLTGRRYRATSGLSMGGFTSLYLSARYPDLVGSASSFNSGPEFFAGEPGRRSLWRPKDHVLNHEHTMVRLIRASGDFISQYHEETRAAYAATPSVDFEYRQDEYHRHWATSIAETFDFHMRAFSNAALDTVPAEWNYTSAQRDFEAWGYRVRAEIAEPALISLQHASQRGFRLTTRRWAPDGPPASCSSLEVRTSPLYRPGASYRVLDYAFADGKSTSRETQAGADGRLSIKTDCGGHEISLTGPGAGAQAPELLPLSEKDLPRLAPGVAVRLPIRVLNPRGSELKEFHAELTSAYPTVEILRGKSGIQRLGSGEVADLSQAFQVRFTSAEGDFARVRLDLTLHFDGDEVQRSFDVLVAPPDLAAPAEIAVLDGRTQTFPVFRQKGNQGGGASIQRTVTEGKGNGNGVLEPGEEATIWVKRLQGLDPFDKNNWCRAKVYADSPWLTEVSDIQEEKQREWTGAQNRTSLIRLSREIPAQAEVPLVLDCESWSFTFTPDVRYGKEPLYQAFQLHKHHLFAWTWRTTKSSSDHSKE
jgi:pimeloyl-ACP methyl ester carboxylesterase